jgi:hypothetical protein
MGVYQVQANGKAPAGLKAGDQVVTGGGTYTITGVNADGTYKSSLTNTKQTTATYDPSGWIGNSKADTVQKVNIGTVENPLYIDATGGRAGYTNESSKSGSPPGSLKPGASAAYSDAAFSGAIAGNEQYYQQLLADMQAQYAAIGKQQEEAQRAALAAGVGQLEGNRTGIQQGYDDLARQLYIDRRQAERKIPQQLSAQGYSGGLAESSNVNLQTAYQELLAQGERARLGEMSNLDTAIANLQASGDLSIAQAGGDISREAMAAYMQIAQAQAADKRWAAEMSASQQQFAAQQAAQQQQLALNQKQWAAQQAWDQQKWTQGLSDNEYNQKLKMAQLLAEYGDFSGYANLGINTSTMEDYYRRLLAQQTAAKSGGGGGGGVAAPQFSDYATTTPGGAAPATVSDTVYGLQYLYNNSSSIAQFREAAKRLGYSEAMISKFLVGN